jgi:hypothetical protein
MRIEIRIDGDIIGVRFVKAGSENVRLWNNLYPGQVHGSTRLNYDQLRELGEGIHEVQ